MSEMKTMSMFEIDEVAAKREEIEKLADDVHDKIIVNKTVPAMRESIFAGYFLPKLTGTVKDPDNTWISEWISAVGSVATEVDIVHDITREVIFRAPPLLQTNKLGLRKGEGTLQDIVKGYMMRTGNPVANPEGYMKHKLGETFVDLVKELDLSDDVKKWHWILVKYNYIESEETIEDVEGVEGSDVDVEDLIIYD